MLSWLFKKRGGVTAAGTAAAIPVLVQPRAEARAEAKARQAEEGRADWAKRLQSAQGDDEALLMVAEGDELIVDGDAGLALKVSTPEVRRYYEIQERTNRRRREALEPIAQRPGLTRDGVRLEIGANASMPVTALSTPAAWRALLYV